ncbi:MAG: phosphoribosylformylglycinamidine synthase [Chloroflexi bacterium]|nr:MAG: phosphoribosylformylglycinamidine synthase [Chloroflexota bacterium]RLC96949.1 MAG: phosphoribosylformylglycinamidine synthase [Chloroflexota bacterium]
MFKAKVYVSLKPTVNDPQGLTIRGALHGLGFDRVNSVRAGKYLEIMVNEEDQARAEAQVDEMCRKVLANPVIETYHFELERVSG